MEQRSGYILVVAEKPDAAVRIARALGKPERKEICGVDYHEIQNAFDGNHYVVCAAAGHLYALADPARVRSIFPVFDVDWFPQNEIQTKQKARYFRGRKSTALASRSRNRIQAISMLSENASHYVQACDFDLEGETIGANIIRFACHKERQVLRAKFSTLTDQEVRGAFSNLKEQGIEIAAAGAMRHFQDFVWGINISRALSESSSSGSEYRLLTMGRVQGPTLAFVVDREIEVMTHVPIPYWAIFCDLQKDEQEFVATYEQAKVITKSLADEIYKQVSKEEKALVKSVLKSIENVPPQFPFNLGDLQKEAYRIHGISPSRTLSIAERLYLDALISYPRTDSQKLPPSIGYSKIIHDLGRNAKFSQLVDKLLSTRKSLFPRQGPKDDPAHPAIYPTGQSPARSPEQREWKIYELIVRRFLASFAENSVQERISAILDIASHQFKSYGRKIIERGWLDYYQATWALGEKTLPDLSEGEIVKITDAHCDQKYEPRPSRYSESSLLSKLEHEGVGTKATRADIISALVEREYLVKSSVLKPNEVGFKLVEAARFYCPVIVSTEMTRDLESKIEGLSNRTNLEFDAALDGLSALRKALEQLHGTQEQVRLSFKEITNTSPKLRSAPEVIVGRCPSCNSGSLKVIRSIKTGKRFLGCTNYQKGCKTTAPLPQRGAVRPTKMKCPQCSWPLILVWMHWKKSSWKLCPNPTCRSKEKLTAISG